MRIFTESKSQGYIAPSDSASRFIGSFPFKSSCFVSALEALLLFELLDLWDFHSDVMNYLYRIIQKQTSPSPLGKIWFYKWRWIPKKKKTANSKRFYPYHPHFVGDFYWVRVNPTVQTFLFLKIELWTCSRYNKKHISPACMKFVKSV